MSNGASFFSDVFGRNEGQYEDAKKFLISIYDKDSHSFIINGKNYPIGQLITPTLVEAKEELKALSQEISAPAKISTSSQIGNAYDLHQDQDGANVIMVASQFNLLEFLTQTVIPEHGITGYYKDITQGPACAMAAPFATAFRNYLVKIIEGKITQADTAKIGQSEDNQINTLVDTMRLLNEKLASSGEVTSNQSTKFDEPIPDGELLFFKNGYIDSTDNNLQKLNNLIKVGGEQFKQQLKDSMRIGIHRDVLIADTKDSLNPVFKTQVLASAIPVSTQYSSVVDPNLWEPFARLVLEAQYEHTILESLRDNANRIKAGEHTKPILLTALGGGVFANKPEWIKESMALAVEKAGEYGIPFEVSINYFNDQAKNQWGDVSFLQPSIAKAQQKIDNKIADQKALESPAPPEIEEVGLKKPTHEDIIFNLATLKSLDIIATAIRDNDHNGKPVVNYYVSHQTQDDAINFSQKLRDEYGITGKSGNNKHPIEKNGKFNIILTQENIDQIAHIKSQEASPISPSLEASQQSKSIPALNDPETIIRNVGKLKEIITYDVSAGYDTDPSGNPVINYKIEFNDRDKANIFSSELKNVYNITGQSGNQKYPQSIDNKFYIILTEKDVNSIIEAPSKSLPPVPAPVTSAQPVVPATPVPAPAKPAQSVVPATPDQPVVWAELGFPAGTMGGVRSSVTSSIVDPAPPSRHPAPGCFSAFLNLIKTITSSNGR